MKIMTDTNVIISAVLNKGSTCDKVLNDICTNYELVLCDYIIKESYQVTQNKFPTKTGALNELFMSLKYEFVSDIKDQKIKISDVKDQPILNSIMQCDIDILVTGDKHFLSLNLIYPQIISPTEYKEKYIK